MTAIKLCVVEKRVYTQEVLAVVFQQLMDQNPLPTLMMRTVLQSLNIHPKLSGFVMNMLQRLIVKQVLRPCLSVLYCHCCWKNSRISLSSKIHDTINFFLMLCFSLSLSLSIFLSFFLSFKFKVWKQKKAWEGFRKCCENTKPQSFAVILQLPPKILQELLEKSPGIKDPLLAHVMAFTDNQVLIGFDLTFELFRINHSN